jgi:putative Holliday junction resolvase
MRVLAVDPGEVRIGLAISDATGTLARPLTIILHEARDKDPQRIAALAAEHKAEMIIVGLALNEHGRPTRTGRKASQMVTRLRGLTDLPVELWEESDSTREAHDLRIELGRGRKSRRQAIDAEAAARILQSYLDSTKENQ